MKDDMKALLRTYGKGNAALDEFVDKCLRDFTDDEENKSDAVILERHFINGEPAKDVAEALYVSSTWFSSLCARCLARVKGRWEQRNAE